MKRYGIEKRKDFNNQIKWAVIDLAADPYEEAKLDAPRQVVGFRKPRRTKGKNKSKSIPIMKYPSRKLAPIVENGRSSLGVFDNYEDAKKLQEKLN